MAHAQTEQRQNDDFTLGPVLTILNRNLPPLPSRLYRGCVPVCPNLPPPPPLWYLMFTPQVAMSGLF